MGTPRLHFFARVNYPLLEEDFSVKKWKIILRDSKDVKFAVFWKIVFHTGNVENVENFRLSGSRKAQE
jgi:hypothetical protein